MSTFRRPAATNIGAVAWTILFALISLASAVLLILVTRSKLQDAPHPERMYGLVAVILAVSGGLVAQRQWAALLFAVGSASLATLIAFGSLNEPVEYGRGALVEALVFCFPLLVVYWYWRSFRWRGRFGL
jgi:uncharacterized membrane protein YhaH (DUF805 family)